MNLVTGATGFLGGHVVDRLVSQGAPVRALVRSLGKCSRLQQMSVELVIGSLEDHSSLEKATTGVDRVFHCAAVAADFGPWALFRSANVDGVDALLRAAERAGVRKFVHVSTCDVYGHPNGPAREDAPFRKRGWPYGDTKIEGEERVWSVHRRSGFPVTIIRPASIYGPRSPSFVLEVVELLKKGQMVHVAGGHAVAGLAYVTNVVDLMLLAADAPGAVGQAYNVADGSRHTWRTYVDRLADIVGVKRPVLSLPKSVAYAAGWTVEKTWGALGAKSRPLLTRLAVEVFGTDQDFPIDKAGAELGYRPAVDFDRGMEAVGNWLRETRVI
jgi:nucleoside-diphosphate-sugar epimerase